MLLQRLREYAEQLPALPPTLYAEAPVRYVVELFPDGRPRGPRPIDTADEKNKRGKRMLVPQVQRTLKVTPLLLADKADYVLGLGREDANPTRVATCHRAFCDLVDRCAAATREPAVSAVAAFLAKDPLSQLELPSDFDPGATITFRVGSIFPIDLPAVQRFWAEANDPSASADGPAPVMQCLVCGEDRPVLRRLQAKVKGVPGGQTSGTSLISANANAFESYGLEASLIAPTCAACGERFTQGLNDLLAKDSSCVRIGRRAACVYWTREQVEFSLDTHFTEPDPAAVRALLEAVRTGKRVPRVDDVAFYATVLSGSGGRAVVRDWIDTTVGEVKRHLARWHRLQEIVGDWGEAPRPLGLYALAYSTVREPDDLPSTVPRALMHAALTGTPPPYDLLHRAVRRNHAEQRLTRPRAALIKLVLLGNQASQREGYLVQLEQEHESVAYHCGRLLAVLEDVQHVAIPGAKATIVDRFFGTASSAPATVFGRLMRGAQPHLSKVQRDRPPVYRALQRRIEEISASIPRFPLTLNLEEQGLFSLGYYHQRAFDRGARIAARQRRAAGTAAPEATDDDRALGESLVQADREE